MDAIPTFNYDAFPLEQKHQWMQSGPGGAAAIGFGGGLAQLGADFAASDTNVGQNLIQRKLADDWQGRASSAAGDAVNRAAASLAGTAVPGRTGGDSSHQYGDSFNRTKIAIPEAPSVGQNSFWGRAADELGREFNDMFGSTFGVQSDYSKRLAAYRAADQAANDALRKHEQTARTALTAYQGAITVPAAASGSGSPSGAGGRGGAAGTGTGGGGGTGAMPPPGSGGGTGSTGGTDMPGAPPPGGDSTTTPQNNTFSPLPPPPSGTPGLAPAPGGGYVPTPSAPAPPPAIAPAVPPPFVGGYPGSGHAPGSGLSPLPARPGGLAEAGGRTPGVPGAESGAAAGPGGRPGGPGGMQPGPLGGMGGVPPGEEREHRNNVFIVDDEPFRVVFDDVVAPVIGPSDVR